MKTYNYYKINLKEEGFPNYEIDSNGQIRNIFHNRCVSNNTTSNVTLSYHNLHKTFNKMALYRKYIYNDFDDIPETDKKCLSFINCSKYWITKTGKIWNSHKFLYISTRTINDHGYISLHLMNDNNNRKHFRLHRLLALAFIPIPDKYNDIPIERLEVNHIEVPKDDLNRPANKRLGKLNNNLENLEWVSHKDHAIHTFGNNMRKPLCGKDNPCYGRKLSKTHKAKMVAAIKLKCVGKGNHMYGKTHTNETKLKISKSRKGKCVGKNHHYYNKSISDETRKKLQQYRGIKHWNYGNRLSENTKQKISNAQSGEKSRTSVLNNDQVIEIKKLLLKKKSQFKIAKQFNVSRSAIGGIAQGRTWKNVGPIFPIKENITGHYISNNVMHTPFNCGKNLKSLSTTT